MKSMSDRLEKAKSNQDGFIVDTKTPSRFRDNQNDLNNKTTKKRTTTLLIGIFALIGTLLFSIGIFFSWYSNRFYNSSEKTLSDVLGQMTQELNHNPFQESSMIHILVAGIDEIQNQREGSVLTDTLIIVTVKETGEISLFSIPRDLWIDSLKTKVNALYYYGEESEDTTGSELMSSVVEEITGLPISYVTLLNLEMVEDVINTIGGIDVNVVRGFTDELFPRNDVDPTLNDPELLYETISFKMGRQHFDGATALKFMRSRHSLDDLEGSDEGRRARQQLVIMALMNELQDVSIWSDPILTGNLYALWMNWFEESIPLSEFVSILWHLNNHDMQFKTINIPISDENTEGLLSVVRENKYKQWVYEPLDPTWNQLRSWVDEQLSH